MRVAHAMTQACHAIGRDVNYDGCCLFGTQQIGRVVNLPCRCVTPKKGHFYTSWTGYW